MKLKCMFNHRFIRLNECETEDFNNVDKKITIYSCKYCKRVLWVRTRCMKAHFRINKESGECD